MPLRRRLGLLCLLAALAAPAAAQPPAPANSVPDPVDAEVIIISRGVGRDAISIAYAGAVTDAQVEQDFARVAADLRTKPVPPQIKRDPPSPSLPPLVSGTAELPGLVSWSNGVLNLDPVINALRRYRHLKFTFLFGGKFDLTWPVGEQKRGPVHLLAQPSRMAVAYDVWLDQPGGSANRPPATGQLPFSWPLVVGLALGAVLLSGGIFYLVYVGSRQAGGAARKREGE